MSESTASKVKMGALALSLMIFTSVFGFTNVPRAFFKMGYGAIPWYIIGGIGFFLPFSFMLTELGTAFKKEKGGIYSWMQKSVGPTYAFIGTFMWYAANIIWMVSVSNGILAPLSNAVFGETRLPSAIWMSIFAIFWMLIVTFFSIKGLKSVKKVASVGGVAVLGLNVVLFIGAVIVLFANGFTPATPITFDSFFSSPNPNFTPSLISFVAFMVYAVFAYGGVESAAGLVDDVEKPEKNFPKGVINASIIITVGYSVAILFTGFFIDYQADWSANVAEGTYHLGNIGYQMMSDLGVAIGNSLNLGDSVATGLGQFLARYMGISMFLALTGAFFTLIFSPLKQTIVGTPEKLWPGKIGELTNGLPKRAMIVQLIIVLVIIVINMLLSLSNPDAADIFFQVLTDMTNVAITLPYLFLVYAYYRFKNNDNIEKTFVIFKSKGFVAFLTVLLFIIVGFANFFSIIEPLVDYMTASFPDAATQAAEFSTAMRQTFSMILGPIIFAIIAVILMNRYKKNHKEEYEKMVEENKK